ncbi:hypothetical protein [Labilibacter marinus]|uniref:hypothetical protein n=1 Tax=Labilibacter marinus TaxID=1477105 RepID=UPI00094FB86E|nr:hypothetical protein [Labilibacter marinus]
MIDFNDIEINKFQLNTLLNHQEKRGFKYLLSNELLCETCNQHCNSGVSNYKIFLDRFNDIKVSGECTVCSSNVNMVMPFGENESFFRKAMQFRNTHAVLIES